MRKTILAATMLILASMVAPRHAASQVSIDIEKPGLWLHAGPPVYGPPVVVAPPPAVVYQGYPPLLRSAAAGQALLEALAPTGITIMTTTTDAARLRP